MMLGELDNGIPNTLLPFLIRLKKHIFGFLSNETEFLSNVGEIVYLITKNFTRVQINLATFMLQAMEVSFQIEWNMIALIFLLMLKQIFIYFQNLRKIVSTIIFCSIWKKT